MTPAATKKPAAKNQKTLFRKEVERSPISQKTMPRVLLVFTMRIRKTMTEERKEVVITPPRRSVLLSIWPWRRPRKYTAVMVAAAPRNAHKGVSRAPRAGGRVK